METLPVTPDRLVDRECFGNPILFIMHFATIASHYLSIPASPLQVSTTNLGVGLLKYHDVYAALRDHETSLPKVQWATVRSTSCVDSGDPPRHTRFRRIVNQSILR